MRCLDKMLLGREMILSWFGYGSSRSSNKVQVNLPHNGRKDSCFASAGVDQRSTKQMCDLPRCQAFNLELPSLSYKDDRRVDSLEEGTSPVWEARWRQIMLFLAHGLGMREFIDGPTDSTLRESKSPPCRVGCSFESVIVA